MYARRMEQKPVTRFAENRKARHTYETLETFEGGLVLTGQEVKAIREGGAKIDGAYLTLIRGELWLTGAHIRPYSRAHNAETIDATRIRKVLVHTKELMQLVKKTEEKGLTLVPFLLYAANRHIKLSFGICRGKKLHDKRESIKKRDLDREAMRHLRGRDVE